MKKLPTITVISSPQLVFEENWYIGRGGSALYHPDTSMYAEWLQAQLEAGNPTVIAELDEIAQIAIKAGKLVLRCYCNSQECHGNIIKQVILNAIQEQYK